MISLNNYILESQKSEKYGTPIKHIDIDFSMSESKLKKILFDAIDESVNKYKIIRITSVEEANKRAEIQSNKKIESKLKEAEKDIIKQMQSKPGILKRSPEKQKEWINNKLEKLKIELNDKFKAYKYNPDINEDNIEFYWRYDIYNEHEVVSYKLYRKDDLINEIISTIKNNKHDEAWETIKSIEFVVKDFIGFNAVIEMVPLFDDETEKKLSKSVKDFNKFLTSMYDSGKYMGD